MTTEETNLITRSKSRVGRIGISIIASLVVACVAFFILATGTSSAPTDETGDQLAFDHTTSKAATVDADKHARSPIKEPLSESIFKPTRFEDQFSNASTPVTSMPQPGAPEPQTSGGKNVSINFDELDTFFQPFEVTSHYPDVRFSSSPGFTVFAYRCGGFDFKSSANCVSRRNFFGNNHFAEFIVDFPKPVDNLRFYIVGVDHAFGTIALLDWNRDGSVVQQNAPIESAGRFAPRLLDFGQSKGIKRVRIHSITDTAGITFDDFTFTVPAATPTPTPIPTPTPTPPPVPTGLKAFPDEEAIDLQWTGSPGATGYIIKRTENPTDDSASAISATAETSLTDDSAGEFNVLTALTSNTTSFRDENVNPDITYGYVVAAVGVGGTSADTLPVHARPLPQNGCSLPAIAPINGGNDMFVNGGGWSLKYNITPNDGLMLRDISLNGRRMAARISVPYFRLETQTTGQSSVTKRGELMPSGTSGGLRSKLVVQEVPKSGVDNGGLFFHVVYAIDQMPGTPKACLLISQDFQFFPPTSSKFNPADWTGPCEPSERVNDCAKFRPMIHYQFNPGSNNESLRVINIPQRHHYEVGQFGKINEPVPTNRAGLFLDADGHANAFAKMGFEVRENPVRWEVWARGIRNGRKPSIIGGICPESGPFDNFHQTWQPSVSTPEFDPGSSEDGAFSAVGAGCPECVHMHWRWGDFQAFQPFGKGLPLLYPPGGSNQQASLDVSVVEWKLGEEDPTDYFSTFRCPGFEFIEPNEPPVFWYSASSSKPDDYMFWHTAWFKAADSENSDALLSLTTGASTSHAATPDGPRSINLGDVFELGENHVETLDVASLTAFPPLPAGYVALNNQAYRITTHSVATGPVTIEFGAASITDQTTFSKLRIFHAEVDPFDPDKGQWIDRTILSPNSPAPDFSAKTLSSKTDHLGTFIIGKLIAVVPPSSDRVNLSVTSTDGPDPVMAGKELTYTITVTNAGPQTAHNVALRNELSGNVFYDAGSASQGTCKLVERKVYCRLGSLNVGASATATLRVLPRSAYTVNYEVENSVTVHATQQDTDPSNDTSVISTTVFPDPNNSPTVVLTSTAAPVVKGPASVQLTATATDTDGTIAKVDFFDNQEFIGNGVAIGDGGYRFNATLQPCSPSGHHHNEEHNHHELPCGTHSLVAIATDNGGKSSLSNATVIFVNGAADVIITSPSAGFVTNPGGSLTLTATATNSTGPISEVEFFANEVLLGQAALNAQNQYSFSWTNLPAGSFKIVAVARDTSNIPSRSAPVSITVGSAPAVSFVTPLQGTTFPSGSKVGISAIATSPSTSVVKVDFYANGILIGTDSGLTNNRFMMTWRQPADGTYSLTAVATDVLGLTTTSAPVNIGINKPAGRPGEVIWFDDELPPGAIKRLDGDVDWYWVEANPGAFSGSKAHQSRDFKAVVAPARTIHSHSFDSAASKLRVNADDKLFTYVFLDVNNMPREIMLEWRDASGWGHRAYWGANIIDAGVNGSASRYYMGSLPKAGQWVRLEVPANNVGLTNTDVDGMSFVLDGGRATWDVSGKTTPAYEPLPEDDHRFEFDAGEESFVKWSLPLGAVPGVTDDQWSWIPCSITLQCHQSVSGRGFRRHFFDRAAPRRVRAGDYWSTWVFLDPNQMPDQLFIEWYDGVKWRRAFWGANHFVINPDTTGTESWRYMGGLPTAGKWVKLEVPASYVGIEGKFVSGMSFGFYSESRNAQITWGESGRTILPGPVPLTLSAKTAVYQFKHESFGYYYSTKEVPLHSTQDRQDGRKFFAYPNQAAGTVPLFRFANSNQTKREFFYSTCANCANPNDWVPNGIAFYVYPNPTPGTVPLHLFRNSAQHYFLTINQSDGAGMSSQGIAGYVHLDNPLVPARPTDLNWVTNACRLNWRDNASTETAYRIDRQFQNNLWTPVVTLPPNTTTLTDCNFIPQLFSQTTTNEVNDSKSSTDRIQPNRRTTSNDFRVIAVNSAGDSVPGEIVNAVEWDEVFQEGDPNINIVSPEEGAIVGKNLVVMANSFNEGGNASLAKVEFFDNGVKLGELTGPPPHNFIWTNAPSGSHTLTAKGTDGLGRTVTSTPVRVTVTAPPTVSVTNPVDGSVITTPANISLQANASDADGSISKVEFFQGETKIGEDVTSPYSVSWTPTSGSYQVTARATDNAGMAVTSLPVTLKVNNPPSVNLSTQPSGTVAPGTEVLLLTQALDSDGTISKVDFYRGTTLIGTVTTFPFIYSWINGPSGTHSLTAKATDNLGAITTSTTVSLVVNSDPSISITSPLHGAIITAGSNLPITASASDPDGTITKVDFYRNTTLIGTDTASPFTVTWNSVPSGTYSLTATVTDNAGAVTTSSVITITANTLPTVSITSPANNTTVNAPTPISISASASDADGSITKVEFFQGTTLIGTDSTTPFTLNWTPAVGTYSLTAKATDNRGSSTTSAPITVISNALPTVSITSPLPRAIFAPASNIIINATANDADGTISKVEFYQGATLIGTDSATPFSAAWNNVVSGSYLLTAKATDNRGAITTSSIVAVTTPTFFDDFNDNSLNTTKWTVTSPTSPVVVSEQSQQLRITVPGNTAAYNSLASKATFDIRGSIVQVEQVQAVNQGGWAEDHLVIEKDGNNYFMLHTGAGSTVLRSMVNGVNDQLVIPYDAVAHRFWRLRHDQSANLAHFETSADAITWVSRKSVTPGFALTAVRFSLVAGAFGTGNSTPGAAIYNDFQLIGGAAAGNVPPTVSIASPAANAVFAPSATIPIVATATDADGLITKVEFYAGTVLIGTDTSAPYSFGWNNVTAGTHSLTAKATDNSGAISTSAMVNVISNAAPAVNLTAPSDRAMFAPGSNITLNANATDPDGTVSSVEFFQGAVSIGLDTTSPYSITWNNVAAGSYSITARATDNRGETTTSAPILISTPTFFDDFNDNSLNSAKWTVISPLSSAVVSEQAQQLRITLPASTATYNGVMSNAFDMRGGTVQLQLIQAVSQAGWAENMLKVELDAQNYLLINVGAGNMLFRSMVNGANDQTIIPYNVNSHRFWRIRHSQSSNSVTFETSNDATTWVAQKTVTAGFALSSVKFHLVAGAYGTSNPAPGAAIYDDFSFIASPVLLSDDFNDNVLDTTKWTSSDLFSGFTDAALPIMETVQRLEIGPLLQGTGGSHYRGIRSVNSYDFTGASCSVELVQPASATTTADAMFTIGKDVDNYYRLYVSGGTLVGQQKIGGTKTNLFTVSFDALNHRFLRIRHAGGNMIMETAQGNGSGPGTWVQRYSQLWSSSVPVTTVLFEVKGGTSAEATAPGKVIFDNFLANR